MNVSSPRVGIELDSNHARALAQLVKRLGWSEMRGCAVDNDEAYEIRDAVCQLQEVLAEAGYAPR